MPHRRTASETLGFRNPNIRVSGPGALAFVLILGVGLVACGGKNGQNDNRLDAMVPDAAQEHDGATEHDATVTPDGSLSTGEASELVANLHDAQGFVALFLASCTSSPDYAGSDWDVSIVRSSPNPPTFTLGPGVTAINLGSAQPFHGVNEAPENGYGDDDPDLIIGITWQQGGTGGAGYQVTGNIYVLRLADGTYAKMEVLSAQGGIVRVLVYHQGDGSRNLATAAP